MAPIEQLEVVINASRVLDEVKRARDALEAESEFMERKHQVDMGKLFNQWYVPHH